MTTTPVASAGTLQKLARLYATHLEAGDQAAAQDMLAAWSDAYWATRDALDQLLAMVAQARADGQPISPSWLSRQRRLKATIAQAQAELTRYAAHAAEVTTARQRAALSAAHTDAANLVGQATAEALPGLAVDLAAINVDNIATAVGFLGDGSPLAEHLVRTIAPDAAAGLRDILIRGMTLGWGQPKLVKAFTEAFAVPHSRAVTIMRTESLRVYRETSRATYEANSHVVGSWTWLCAFDARSCAACVAMSGTRHPNTETLDGHPRCRCTMVPNTRSWAELGIHGVEDTSPTIGLGSDWFARQSAAYQRGLLGPLKYDALKAGRITLADVVARGYDPAWGTMRTERSMKSILARRNRNWGGLGNTLGRPPSGVPT